MVQLEETLRGQKEENVLPSILALCPLCLLPALLVSCYPNCLHYVNWQKVTNDRFI